MSEDAENQIIYTESDIHLDKSNKIIHNSEICLDNGDVLLFQSNDGSLHTISLTPEQIAELGIEVQYNATDSAEELVPQDVELLVDDTVQIIQEPAIPETTTATNVPLHSFVRLTGSTTNAKGFQLITDHVSNNWHTKRFTTSLADDIRIVKKADQFLTAPDDSDSLKQRLFLQSNTASDISNQIGPTLSGQFIITNNDIASSLQLDPKSNPVHTQSVFLSNQPSSILLQAKNVAAPKQLLINGTGSNSTSILKRNQKNKNGVNFKSIDSTLKKSLNIIAPLTPIPLAPKPQNPVLLHSDVPRAARWNKTQNHQTVHVLQTGDQYHSVEQLNGEQLRVVTDALSTVAATPDNPNKVLYDPASKTRIVYRVVYPEDLNLCKSSEEEINGQHGTVFKKLLPKKSPKQKLLQPIPQTAQVVSITRSGRRVRPPRYMALDYEQQDDPEQQVESIIPILLPPVPLSPPTELMSPKKAFSCPVCRKAYRGVKRMARHLHTFPDHAITPASLKILEKYRTETKPKDSPPITNQRPNTNQRPSLLLSEQNKNTNTPTDNGLPKRAELEANKTVSNGNAFDIGKEEKSLFGSLIGILEHTSEDCRASVFVRQLAALVVKLRNLMPCLLHSDKGSSTCLINEPVGRILDLSPGKYQLNMNAFNCGGVQSGQCKHVRASHNGSTPTESQSLTSNSAWMSNATEQTTKAAEPEIDSRSRANSIDKWTTNTISKRKWIPIGSQNNDSETIVTSSESWLSNSDCLINTTPFSQTVDSLKAWDSNLQKKSRNNETGPRSPWETNTIDSLIKLPREITSQSHILSSSCEPEPNDDSLSFDSKMAELPNLVFGIKDQIVLDATTINSKDDLLCNRQSSCSDETGVPENFDFNDSRFDMQIDSDKLNFTSAQYNEMKYGRDALPPFRKIEPAKNLQLPVDALGDISSDADKLHLPTSDTILSDSSFPITSESLDLAMDNHNIDTLNSTIVDPCKTVTLGTNEDTVHCDGQSLLTSSVLTLPISVSSALSRNESMLSVSESSLDGGRLSLTTSQSVLHLLDPLGTDCLSFSDAELRPTSQMSLDLQMDLFPFHHP